MEFVSLNGYLDENSSYISFTIKGGKNHDSIGDQVWISKDGTQMEVCDYADKEVLTEAMQLFTHSHRRAFKGALRRMGVTFD